MKTTLFAAGTAVLLAFLASCGDGDHHGKPFAGFPLVSIADLADRPAEHYRKDHRIEGEMVRQCPVTGCWFYLRDASGKEVKVEMGDTTPKLPALKGRKVAVEGRLIPYGDRTEFVGVAMEPLK
jgi:hypothetical protein